MKKLKYLLLIMVVAFMSLPSVNAAVGIPNINGTEFVTSYSADFADNTNGQITRIGATFSNTSKNYSSNGQITLTGGNTDGSNIMFDALQPFVAGYTYSVSVLIGLDPLFTTVYPKASSTRLCIAENLANVTTRYNNPSTFPCVNAYVTNTVGTPANWNITNSDGTTRTFQYGLLTYVFTADSTATSITMSYQSSARITSTHYFGGYAIELLSDNSSITDNQLQSIIRNSGLATANSVNQVEQGINEVKQEIQAMEQQQQQTNEKLDDLNDNITNNNVDGVEGAFESFDGFISENSTITQLIIMPITLYSSILNGLQSTCQPFPLGNLFGTNLTLPCINIGNYLGAVLWTMIDIIISGFAIFAISKKLVKIFNNFSSMKEGDVIDD